jgi:hypothetical protein
LKTASKSDVGNVLTRRHTPARLLPTRTDARHASHASSSPGWADPTRIPDNPTHVPDPDKDDVIMMPVHIVSMHVSAQSADTSSSSQHAMSASSHLPRHRLVIRHVITVGPTCHVTRCEPSRAELEPSRAASRGTGSSVVDPTCNRI